MQSWHDKALKILQKEVSILILDEPARLVVGKNYRFITARLHSGRHRIAFSSEASILKDTFRFQGVKHDKFVFQHTVGDWTISLSRNQLIGITFKEVKT